MLAVDPELDPAHWGASTVSAEFDAYLTEFRRITVRARERFESRDWRGHQRDARERLDLVGACVWKTTQLLRTRFGESVRDEGLWHRMRPLYAGLVREHPAAELAETFFNSVSRRVFVTVGVDPEIEFVSTECSLPPPHEPVFRTYMRQGSTRELLTTVLESFAPRGAFRDLEEDARAGAERIEPPDALELANAVFYRGKGAYLVGRARRGHETTPVVLALRHGEQGVYLDAVLTTVRDARILFSFARSYFHVDVERPCDLVDFLQAFLPIRRRSELYISIGYNKHGKTELYRELLQHQEGTAERFQSAPGDRGLVMIVFTLPSLSLVFKVIRSRFAPPKSTSREEVEDKYRLVFRHDRAGRLADAQEFEHLAFDVGQFDTSLLEELLSEAGESCRVEGDSVIIDHLYVEKRVRPLNLYLREASPEDARAAVLEYGQAIRDLAATNTFPGDLLLKNFGVTRNGRVIFYDYDELCLITDCNFRQMPTASSDEEELSAEPWFHVDPEDVFPEEFLRFLGFTPDQEQAFLEAHRDLLTSAWWGRIQDRVRSGEIVDVIPYAPEQRLRPAHTSSSLH